MGLVAGVFFDCEQLTGLAKKKRNSGVVCHVLLSFDDFVEDELEFSSEKRGDQVGSAELSSDLQRCEKKHPLKTAKK